MPYIDLMGDNLYHVRVWNIKDMKYKTVKINNRYCKFETFEEATKCALNVNKILMEK